jgi:hypothetical protein
LSTVRNIVFFSSFYFNTKYQFTEPLHIRSGISMRGLGALLWLAFRRNDTFREASPGSLASSPSIFTLMHVDYGAFAPPHPDVAAYSILARSYTTARVSS